MKIEDIWGIIALSRVVLRLLVASALVFVLVRILNQYVREWRDK